FFFSMLLLQPTSTLFPYTTLFRSGSIYGTVSDGTGAVVPNANVTVTNLQTGAKKVAATTESGDYTFLVLDPGDYTVSTQVTGFRSEEHTSELLSQSNLVCRLLLEK